jgi:hypothetical protein
VVRVQSGWDIEVIIAIMLVNAAGVSSGSLCTSQKATPRGA